MKWKVIEGCYDEWLALARAEEHGDVEHKPVFGRCPMVIDDMHSLGTNIVCLRDYLHHSPVESVVEKTLLMMATQYIGPCTSD